MNTTDDYVVQPERLDPDVRFLLANERTLLAWTRTALALLAGGFALSHFGEPGVTTTLGSLTAIVIGASMAIIGYVRYRAADRAIRAMRLPHEGRGPLIQTVTVVAFACLSMILLFVG